MERKKVRGAEKDGRKERKKKKEKRRGRKGKEGRREWRERERDKGKKEGKKTEKRKKGRKEGREGRKRRKEGRNREKERKEKRKERKKEKKTEKRMEGERERKEERKKGRKKKREGGRRIKRKKARGAEKDGRKERERKEGRKKKGKKGRKGEENGEKESERGRERQKEGRKERKRKGVDSNSRAKEFWELKQECTQGGLSITRSRLEFWAAATASVGNRNLLGPPFPWKPESAKHVHLPVAQTAGIWATHTHARTPTPTWPDSLEASGFFLSSNHQSLNYDCNCARNSSRGLDSLHEETLHTSQLCPPGARPMHLPPVPGIPHPPSFLKGQKGFLYSDSEWPLFPFPGCRFQGQDYGDGESFASPHQPCEECQCLVSSAGREAELLRWEREGAQTTVSLHFTTIMEP
ncbi:Octapeptide-repeat protein T2, partial [Ophiophagus hannah]